MTTTYQQAWFAFQKTAEYKTLMKTLQKAGIKQPYRNNIIRRTFNAGWHATGTAIKIIEE